METEVAPLLIALQTWFTSQKKPQVISFLLRCEPALWHNNKGATVVSVKGLEPKQGTL